MRYIHTGLTIALLFFLMIYPLSKQAYAECVNWQGNCNACSCTTSGCNGNQTCTGIDEGTGKSCIISQSCNVNQTKNYSCDCAGQVGNAFYTQTTCKGAQTQCIGELPPNGSGTTCHYCATPLTTSSPTKIPTIGPTRHPLSPTQAPPGTKIDSNIVITIIENPIPGFGLVLSGPEKVNNGDSIEYKVGITYEESQLPVPIEQITIYDALPQGTAFNSTTGTFTYDTNRRLLSWSLRHDNNRSGFDFTLDTTEQNTTIRNFVVATTYDPTKPIIISNPNATDFDSLMFGQGRNTSALGDENSFVKTAMENGKIYQLDTKEPYLHQIYQKAVEDNVNPLAVLVTWGTESGFQANNTEFGCKPFGSGFERQLSCSVNTFDNWMSVFESSNVGGSLGIPDYIRTASGEEVPTGTTKCYYNDPFLYAYEWYGPDCHFDDDNKNLRSRFFEYYTQILRG